MSLADFTEQVLQRRPDIGKNQGGRARSRDTHLVLFYAGGKSGLPLDNERAKLIAVHFGKDHKNVREAAVCNPHLLPIENVMCAVFA